MRLIPAGRNIRLIREDTFPRRPVIEAGRGNPSGIGWLETLDVHPRCGG
jgi:hypothetical protein